jgi:Concanavalin A-like lectin/glucanases superfamily
MFADEGEGVMPRGILKSLFAIVVIASANAFSFSGASAGTIAYYRFEGVPGQPVTTIVDSSGNGNNGAPFGSDPQYNSSVPFAQVPQTGQTDTSSAAFVDNLGGGTVSAVFGYEFPFNTKTNATLELWFDPGFFAFERDFIWGTHAAGDSNRFNFYYVTNGITGTGNLCLDYREPNATLHQLGCTPFGSISRFQWTYVAYVKQGNVYSIYLNNSTTGNVTTLESQVTDTTPNLPTSVMWTMNGRLYAEPNGCCQFVGGIDEVRLSDVALSPDQFLVSPVLSVTIIIKPPAQAPVPINLKSNGALPVAILSSPSFDATQVNPATIKLSGASVGSKGDSTGQFACSAQDVNGDGLPDLVCQLINSELQLASNATMVTLTATTFSGQMISGGEAIKIVGSSS